MPTEESPPSSKKKRNRSNTSLSGNLQEENKQLRIQLEELKEKLDSLKLILCKKCSAINIDNPKEVEHIQKCVRVKNTMSDLTYHHHSKKRRGSLAPIPNDELNELIQERDKEKANLNATEDAASTIANPVLKQKKRGRILSLGSGQSAKQNQHSQEEKLITPPTPRTNEKPSISKILTPFKKKTNKPENAPQSPLSSNTPVTTASGILIPILPIQNPNSTSSISLPIKSSSTDNIKISPKKLKKSKTRYIDCENEEELMEDEDGYEPEAETPRTDNLIAHTSPFHKSSYDSENSPPSGSRVSASSPSGSALLTPPSCNQNLIYSQILLAVHHQLKEFGVPEELIKDLIVIGEFLQVQSEYQKTSSDSDRSSNKKPTNVGSADRLKKLFSRKSTDTVIKKEPSSANNSPHSEKKDSPIEMDQFSSSADPFTKKIQRTKLMLQGPGTDCKPLSRTRSASINSENSSPHIKSSADPVRSRFTRSKSFELLYSWETTPSFHLASRPGKPSTPKFLSFTTSDDGNRVLECGEILDIFEWLFLQIYPEIDDVHSFFICYRNFITPSVLLNILIKKYEESVKLKENIDCILLLFEQWIGHYYTMDFSNDRLLSRQLWSFINSNLKKEYTTHFRELTHSWENQHYFLTQEAKLFHPLPSITPICKIDILSLSDPMEIVQQFTLIEFTLFEKIHIFDYLLKDLNHSKSITATIDHFNRVSLWVATEILKIPTPKKRALAIKQFITIAHSCYEMHNFNTMLEITAGLNLAQITRLRKSWKNVPKRSITILQELESVMDPHQNYKRYRKELASCPSPCLPYLGVIRRDVTMINVGNDDIIEGNLVNFQKSKLMWNVIKRVAHHQRTAYPFSKVPNLYNALNNLFTFDEETLFKYSLEWEPPESNFV